MSFSTSTTNVHGFIEGSLGIVATVSTTANALPSLTTTTMQTSATWNFQSISTQLVSGDKVFYRLQQLPSCVTDLNCRYKFGDY